VTYLHRRECSANTDEGVSLAMLQKATGCGKGRLYGFFLGGKEEMMNSVLVDLSGAVCE
jgi:hypothetical protein